MRKAKFQAPAGITAFGQVQLAFQQIAADLRDATRGGYSFGLHTRTAPEVLTLVSGTFHRVSAPVAGALAVLPRASELNGGESLQISMERMRGPFQVQAAPGQTVNGTASSTFSASGIVEFWSNGVDSWTSVAQLPGTAGIPIVSTTGGPTVFFGADGADGAQGEQGFPGQPGATGPAGPRGADGEQGDPGDPGFPGSPGATGPTGATGASGSGTTGLAPFGVFELDLATEPGEFVPRGWGADLRSNPRTGGASAFVDVGDQINFGAQGPAAPVNLSSGETTFRIRGTNAMSVGGGTGAVFFTSGVGATTELAADSGTALISTSTVGRLSIDSSGVWTVGGVAGAAGNVITHQGASPPIWAAPVLTPGPMGPSGQDGQDGNDGIQGPTGPAGATGATGATGASGSGTAAGLAPFCFEIEQADEPKDFVPRPGWAAALRSNAHTGGASAFIDLGDILNWAGSSTQAAMAMNVTAATNDWVATGAGDVLLQGGNPNLTIKRNGGLEQVLFTTQLVEVTASGVTGAVRVKATALFVEAGAGTNGFVDIAEAATSLLTVAAGHGQFWVRSDTPNLPMFTDDTNVDVPLKQVVKVQTTAATVAAATTTLDCCSAGFSVPANTMVVGSRFRVDYTIDFIRGATATIMNITFQMVVGATGISVVPAVQTAAATYQVRIIGEFTVLTTGAGGTAMGTLSAYGGGISTPATGQIHASNVALAVNTTAATTIRGIAAMSAIVAGTTIRAMGGHIEWLN